MSVIRTSERRWARSKPKNSKRYGSRPWKILARAGLVHRLIWNFSNAKGLRRQKGTFHEGKLATFGARDGDR
jgi:hypothetical protein